MVKVDSLDGNGTFSECVCFWGLANTHFRLFIVDGIISLPIAVAGYFIIPDMPQNSRAWYLKKEAGSSGNNSSCVH